MLVSGRFLQTEGELRIKHDSVSGYSITMNNVEGKMSKQIMVDLHAKEIAALDRLSASERLDRRAMLRLLVREGLARHGLLPDAQIGSQPKLKEVR